MGREMKRESNRQLALQMAHEHLLSLRQLAESSGSGLADLMLGHFCGLYDSLERARIAGTLGPGHGGVCCACHGGGFGRRHKADCARCHGTGTVPIGEIRKRAEAKRDHVYGPTRGARRS